MTIVVPQVTGRVLDRAIQVYGAEGICQDQILAEAFAQSRTLRIADGPDEVHLLYVPSVTWLIIDNLGDMKRERLRMSLRTMRL